MKKIEDMDDPARTLVLTIGVLSLRNRKVTAIVAVLMCIAGLALMIATPTIGDETALGQIALGVGVSLLAVGVLLVISAILNKVVKLTEQLTGKDK